MTRSEIELKYARKRLETIANACRRHIHSGVATSNHHLIVQILRLAEDALAMKKELMEVTVGQG